MTTETDLGIATCLSALERQVGSIEAELRAMEPIRTSVPRARKRQHPGTWRLATVVVILVSAALLGPLLL